MEGNRRLAVWMGAVLGAFFALLLNSALAHARDAEGAISILQTNYSAL
jgi:hypothetical protein